MRGHIKAFFALSFTGNRQFQNTKEKAAGDAHACRISTPRRGEYRYSIRRGSGLFISCWAFGDASCKVNKKSFHAFFVLTINRQIGNGGDTQKQ